MKYVHKNQLSNKSSPLDTSLGEQVDSNGLWNLHITTIVDVESLLKSTSEFSKLGYIISFENLLK